MNRKHLYLILYDMIKSHRIAGSRVLSIMAENLAEETAEDIIKYVLQLIPIIIQSYVPIESVTDYNVKLFKALIALMESGKFTATSTKQMLINSLFSFCQSEEHRNMILEWFESGKITSTDGITVCEGFVVKQRHIMVKKIFASTTIS